MGTLDALRDLDAQIHAGFGDSVDTGAYTAPTEGAVAVPCRCYVHYAAQVAGEFARTFGARITVDIFLTDVPAPADEGVIVIGSETFKLDAPDPSLSDPSLMRWVVLRV